MPVQKTTRNKKVENKKSKAVTLNKSQLEKANKKSAKALDTEKTLSRKLK